MLAQWGHICRRLELLLAQTVPQAPKHPPQAKRSAVLAQLDTSKPRRVPVRAVYATRARPTMPRMTAAQIAHSASTLNLLLQRAFVPIAQ